LPDYSIAQRPTVRRRGFRVTETARPVVFRTEIPPDTDEDADHGGKPPSVLKLLLSWRNWNIPTKLTAVTLVPVVFAVVLGAMQIADQVAQAQSYRQVDRLVAAGGQLRPLVGALQQERTATSALLAAGPPNAATLGPKLAEEQRNVDVARTALLRAAHRASYHNEITMARFTEVSARLDELPGLRAAIAAGGVDAPGALGKYTVIIGALLNFDRAAAAEVIDPALAGTAVALHDLQMSGEEIRYQQALVGIGLTRGGLTDVELAELHASMGRLDDRSAELRLDASAAQQQDYARLVTGLGVESRERLAKAAAATPPGTRLPVDAADWNLASEYTAGRIGAVATLLGTQIVDRSKGLQDEASTGAGIASVILLIALVVAGMVMFVIGRHLLRSLNVLRHSALDVAEHALPEAVERIREVGEHADPAVEPVPVSSTDEVGQVARAFEAVHRQALRLATEQAGLRARYSDVFVNLSRRSQGLVQRQLRLLERLERDEEDAEQLATLFQLDHLATRMRRNNENLMVLSGSELGRRNQRPASLADLLRAAVSEIEQYQRVVMLPPTDVLIVGYAVGDLVRLVAELLDNATAFSAPSTQVTIASHSFEDGSVCIAVLDEGIGMSESELASANEKLSNAHTVDVSTSRRMGLFVVGRLAGRHGVEVSLHGGKNIPGIRATVTVPADLVTVTATDAPAPKLLPESSNGHQNGSANGAANGRANGFTPSPLPRREKPSNGSSTPDIKARLLGEAAQPRPEPPVEPENPTERIPLPKRSPGASTFVKPVDTAAGPVDLALPGQAPPNGDSLFLPSGSDWWGSVPNGQSVEETTPIFDEMISAWFRAISELPEEGTEEEWRFASDAGFDAARAVSESQPDSFTESGLPRRNPRQNLVPGSAGEAAPSPGHDPEELRKRLNNYKSGVSRARDQRVAADEPGGPPTLDLSAAGWRFAPDRTSGGLPRRSAPGPTPDGRTDVPRQPDRAEQLRGRLGNFQAGLNRGRRSLAELADQAHALGDEITAGAKSAEQIKRESE
jgi:signal transduction histidine kinase